MYLPQLFLVCSSLTCFYYVPSSAVACMFLSQLFLAWISLNCFLYLSPSNCFFHVPSSAVSCMFLSQLYLVCTFLNCLCLSSQGGDEGWMSRRKLLWIFIASHYLLPSPSLLRCSVQHIIDVLCTLLPSPSFLRCSLWMHCVHSIYLIDIASHCLLPSLSL